MGRLLVTGAQTDACIRATLHGALVRGYDTTLVEDAHTTEDLRRFGMPIGPEDAIACTNTYWRYTEAPGRATAVTPAAEVELAPA
ncbi:isochorismatase family protein [Blastococcus sp. TML/M2B]|uniref:isochorismatase family protein n=1 Tax=unclassified Blastococcus TaxID=2619396 RepID=UPI00190CA5C6|nr:MULTISPECIES: isochorismatase family protein [unclassified Blastococcus]MBN1091792.1 isochorismatase family protein [Blastococcus sp. TML/M2B]MBN1094648.1 isochorismatase family protein [Blastococcus sp. TML/C7B]